jgi:hypothetical protein
MPFCPDRRTLPGTRCLGTRPAAKSSTYTAGVIRQRSFWQSPEVVVPGAILLIAAVLLAVALAVVKPEASVAAALIAAVVAAYGSVISLILTRFFERRQIAADRALELDREARAKKIPVYEAFVGFWLDALFATQLGKKPLTAQQVTQGIAQWTKPILMWGSDRVVREWGRLRIELAQAQPGNYEGLFRFEQFLIELRRDAGYPDTALSRGDLLRLWVNDIDTHL